MKKVISKGLVASALVGCASSAMAQVALAPLKADQAHTILLVSPYEKKLDNKQKASLNTIREKVFAAFNEVFPVVLSNMGTALSGPGGAKSVIAATAKELQATLEPRLGELNVALPDDPIYLTSYVLPWKKGPDNYIEQNSPDFPLFKVLQFEEVNWEEVEKTSIDAKGYKIDPFAKVYHDISQSIRESIAASKGNQFTLIGAALQLRLQKNRIAIRAQLLGTIDPTTREFKKDNPQVSLHTLSIPMQDEKVQDRPIALVTITQAIQGEKAKDVPDVQIDLGTFGGINGGLNEVKGWFGQFQTLQNDIDVLNPTKNLTSATQDSADCKMSVSGLPALIGILGPAPTDKVAVNAILKKLKPMNIQFRIKRIKLNPVTLKVDDMSVLTQVGSMQLLRCLAMKDVSEQVKGEANAAIEDAIKSIYAQDDVTDKFFDEMYK